MKTMIERAALLRDALGVVEAKKTIQAFGSIEAAIEECNVENRPYDTLQPAEDCTVGGVYWSNRAKAEAAREIMTKMGYNPKTMAITPDVYRVLRRAGVYDLTGPGVWD